MPETASLHIRDRGLKTTRVVALSGDYVRIGRSPICDVLLLDPNIARVECHLSREGDSWTIAPERSDGRVWHRGARLSGSLRLKEGETISVGENIVTFHLAGSAAVETSPVAEPAIEIESEPEPAPSPELSIESPSKPEIEMSGGVSDSDLSTASASPGGEWTSRAEIHKHLLQTRAETRKWESRWRSVGEKLKESSVAAGAAARRPIGTSFSPSAEDRGPLRAVPTPPSPSRASAHRFAERPLPSASRITREIREAPRARLASPPPRPLGPEVNSPIPSSAPSYDSPRPKFAPSPSSYRADRSRKPTEPAPAGTSDASIRAIEPASFEAASPTQAEGFETGILPEVMRTSPERRDVERFVEPILDDEDEAMRENEPPTKRTLGSTRRLGALSRRPNPAPQPPRAAVSLVSEPPIEVVPRTEIDPESQVSEPLVAVSPTTPVMEISDVLDTFQHEPEIADIVKEPAPKVAVAPSPHDPFVTDTFRRDPLVWQESTVAATPFQMPNMGHREQTRFVEPAQDSAIVESSSANPRHDRYRRSHRDAELQPAARRDPSLAQDWPSVSDIFANRPPRKEAARPTSRAKAKPGAFRPRPEPTVAHEPAQWTVPLWLGWAPSSAASLLILAALVGISWFWTVDNYNAGMVARRLDKKAGVTKPLPEEVEPGPTQWWRTSANHVLTWVRYLDRADHDPAKMEEARELLQKASEISPLSATIRHAAAIAASDPKSLDSYALAKAVGQSRDILTLTHAGGQLLRAGKMNSAREAYRRALQMAASTGPDQPISPILDGAQIRFSLPGEDLLAPVIRDMARQTTWNFEDWQSAIPRRSVAPFVAARVLHELRHRDAKAALALAREDAISETLIAGANRSENTTSAILLAAEAEALAMDDKLKEALECYRSAIERMPIDRVVRSWWLNFAELARRLNQDFERRKALELAKCDDPKDEVTVQAVELQKGAGDFIGQTADKGKRDPETRAASTSVE